MCLVCVGCEISGLAPGTFAPPVIRLFRDDRPLSLVAALLAGSLTELSAIGFLLGLAIWAQA
jgi:hypothetical protein